MNPKISIKPLQIENLPNFFKLYQQTCLESFPEWTKQSKEQWFAEDYSPKFWQDLINNKKYPLLIAYDGQQMVGYVAIEGIDFGVAYLGWIAVLKTYQGQGIGHQLMEQIAQWCLALGKIHKIELETQLPELQAFYEKHGYILEGVRKKSWQKLDNYMFGKVLG